jgi:hypothetical protein
MKTITQIHTVLGLRMCGAIPLLPLLDSNNVTFLHRYTVVTHWPIAKTVNKTSRGKWRKHKYNDKERVRQVFMLYSIMSPAPTTRVLDK